MRDIPIIFSAQMILALIAGRKTMTRRLAWKRKHEVARGGAGIVRDFDTPSPWQRVKPGDRLWVRESLTCVGNGIWRWVADQAHVRALKKDNAAVVAYQNKESRGNVPSIHMSRWASRLTLIVTATKIERLNDISESDALAEGVPGEILNEDTGERKPFGPVALMNFGALWENLHGNGSWLANPEVCAISFSVHKTNIDAMPKSEAA